MKGHSTISPINAYDNALVDKKVSDVNYVRISSILPSYSEREEFHKHIIPGNFYYTAKSEAFLNKKNDNREFCGIALAISKDPKKVGYIFETTQNHSSGLKKGILKMLEKRNLDVGNYDIKIYSNEIKGKKNIYQYIGIYCILFSTL